MDVITHPFPNFNVGSAEPPLKLWDVWVIYLQLLKLNLKLIDNFQTISRIHGMSIPWMPQDATDD